MSTPKYLISAEEFAEGSWNKDSAGIKKDRNPSWCVAFVRFKTPGAMFRGEEDAFAERSLLVVENDCVDVQTNAPKGSFQKSATITMKLGEIDYQNAVAPGDWVFVWMASTQDSIDNILDDLMGPNGAGPRSLRQSTTNPNVGFNSWQSGLKFCGRVMGTPSNDSIMQNGTRTLTQVISCQSFIELASSVYYTFVAANIQVEALAGDQEAAGTNFYTNQIKALGKQSTVATQPSIPGKSISNGLEVALTNLSKAFDNFYRRIDGKTPSNQSSPEAIIGLLFIITMGIDLKNNQADQAVKHANPNAQGVFSDAIGIPKTASTILGRKTKNKLWQCYSVYMGLQKYASTGKKPWVDFSPIFTPETQVKDTVFYKTPTSCKGFIPFKIPPIWENNTFWNIYSQFLNPVCNEMYTALRINRDGKIMPSLIVREKPFSTNLFQYLLKVAPVFQPTSGPTSKESKGVSTIRDNQSTDGDSKDTKKLTDNYVKQNPVDALSTERTMFANLPRWIIHESVIKSVNVSSNEANRINFVQVWGRSAGIEMLGFNGTSGLTQESLKINQLNAHNYVCDEKDVQRHGLRADITECNFDVISDGTGTITPILARLRADWSFNGHLKLAGTIVLEGVQEPICEGDNCQVRGVLFHIEAVSHSGSLAGNGSKVFTTTLTVSNGMIAKSLDSKVNPPSYAVGNSNFDSIDSLSNINNLPGITDIQNTGSRKGRDNRGESLVSKKKQTKGRNTT